MVYTAKQNKAMALKKAREYAKMGNHVWAQHFVNHAAAFWPVTKRELNNVNKCFPKVKVEK
jgi:hypothetical protein